MEYAEGRDGVQQANERLDTSPKCTLTPKLRKQILSPDSSETEWRAKSPISTTKRCFYTCDKIVCRVQGGGRGEIVAHWKVRIPQSMHIGLEQRIEVRADASAGAEFDVSECA